jgi:hypothetical protein
VHDLSREGVKQNQNSAHTCYEVNHGASWWRCENVVYRDMFSTTSHSRRNNFGFLAGMNRGEFNMATAVAVMSTILVFFTWMIR